MELFEMIEYNYESLLGRGEASALKSSYEQISF